MYILLTSGPWPFEKKSLHFPPLICAVFVISLMSKALEVFPWIFFFGNSPRVKSFLCIFDIASTEIFVHDILTTFIDKIVRKMTVIQKNWNIQKCLMQKSSLYAATSVSNNSGIKLQSIRVSLVPYFAFHGTQLMSISAMPLDNGTVVWPGLIAKNEFRKKMPAENVHVG